MVAGVFGIFVTAKIFKKANYKGVAYVLSTIVITVTVLTYFMMYAQNRAGMADIYMLDMVEILSVTVGTVAGYFAPLYAIRESQKQYVTPAFPP